MWQTVDNKLYRKFSFKDFNGAIRFINGVADIANKLDHHPTIHNTYNLVELWLSTHSAGDRVTDKDHQLASSIDKFYKSYPEESAIS